MRQRKEELLGDDDAPEVADEAPTLAAAAESSQERRRLERLQSEQDRAVREAFFTGVTYSELAQKLAVPLGTMKSWIRRSLMQLKACLEQ